MLNTPSSNKSMLDELMIVLLDQDERLIPSSPSKKEYDFKVRIKEDGTLISVDLLSPPRYESATVPELQMTIKFHKFLRHFKSLFNLIKV